MKSSKEFFERLQTDEAFAKEVNEAIIEKRNAGAKNYFETFIPVAKERGYEISEEELTEIYESQASELSEEELGKVAGGTSCMPAWITWAIATFATASMVGTAIYENVK